MTPCYTSCASSNSRAFSPPKIALIQKYPQSHSSGETNLWSWRPGDPDVGGYPCWYPCYWPSWDITRAYYRGPTHLPLKHTNHDSVHCLILLPQGKLSPCDSDFWDERNTKRGPDISEFPPFWALLTGGPFPDPDLSLQLCLCSPKATAVEVGGEVGVQDKGAGVCGRALPVTPCLLMSFFWGWNKRMGTKCFVEQWVSMYDVHMTLLKCRFWFCRYTYIIEEGVWLNRWAVLLFKQQIITEHSSFKHSDNSKFGLKRLLCDLISVLGCLCLCPLSERLLLSGP